MYQGYYINLDQNQNRRQALIAQLEGIGAASRYQRFAAVDGRAVAHQYPTRLDAGSLGIWLSHIQLLEAAAGCSAHLHVIEDDVTFATNALASFDSVLAVADAEVKDWDLIFTDVTVTPRNLEFFLTISHAIKDCEQTGKVILFDLKPVAFSGASSFFINRHSIAKYAGLLADHWRHGVNIDIFIRALAERGLLKVCLTVPFLTSASRDSLHSTIVGGEVNRSRAVIEAYRRLFFQNADLPALRAELAELTKGATHSPMREFYLQALSFCLSDQYVDY